MLRRLSSAGVNALKNTKTYDWHGEPYSYYSLAKEIDLPFKSFEIILSNHNDPMEQSKSLRKNKNKKYNHLELLMKLNSINKNKLCIPIVDTIVLENGQILGWFLNDKKTGYVIKQSVRKLTPEYLIKYFFTEIKNSKLYDNHLIKQVSELKVLSDLTRYANYIIQKGGESRDTNIFRKNNLEYIIELEKIKIILVYYYSREDPILIKFVDFYFLLNEHGGINSIKMIQNCINCKFNNN